MLAGTLATGLGIWLGRRYGAVIRREWILWPSSPWWQAVLAFLGDALVVLGLIAVMIGVMVAFF